MNQELKRTIQLLDKLTKAVRFYNWYNKQLPRLLSTLLFALNLHDPNCTEDIGLETLKMLNDRLEKI